MWNVLKYIKKFRDRADISENINEFCDKNILLNVTESGHSGEVGRSHGIKDKAM